MGSLSIRFCKVFLLIALFSSLQLLPVSSLEFEVGGTDGWIVPSSNNTESYNEWASKNRFQVGDSVNFKYKKDSVMVVNDVDYNNCSAAHPLFFSNDGDSTVQLDRPGLFYFISGATGHCEKGQKMIIKVLSHSPEGSPNDSNDSGGDAARLCYPIVVQVFLVLILFLVSVFMG